MQRSRSQRLWRIPSNKPSYSSVRRLPKQRARKSHRDSAKSWFYTFSVVYLATASTVCPLKLIFCLNPLKPDFFATLSVKHCKLRTAGQRSSKRVCRNDRTSSQAISALLWNDSSRIQFFLSNWYVLLIEKSNLKGQGWQKRNPINRKEFQIWNILCGLGIYHICI